MVGEEGIKFTIGSKTNWTDLLFVGLGHGYQHGLDCETNMALLLQIALPPLRSDRSPLRPVLTASDRQSSASCGTRASCGPARHNCARSYDTSDYKATDGGPHRTAGRRDHRLWTGRSNYERTRIRCLEIGDVRDSYSITSSRTLGPSAIVHRLQCSKAQSPSTIH